MSMDMSRSHCSQHEHDDDEYLKDDRNDSDMLTSLLPKAKGWFVEPIYQYQSFWLIPSAIKGVKKVQECFNVQPTDILLATSPKSGTTWFKALIFSIMNRATFDFSSHPLLTKGPHDCIPFLESIIQDETSYQNYQISCSLFATHIPYSLLPPAVSSSGCKIVYVFRDAKDVFVSNWHFATKLRQKQKELPSFPMEDAFDLFCKGVSHYGPCWDHVLGYWKASMENPDKVLFVTYEDMKKDPVVCLTKLAKFLDKPFSLEEERQEVVQDIVRLCSFENLSSLEVNQTGVLHHFRSKTVENRQFLRKGQVGDWKNHLTQEMAEQLDEITRQKFGGTSLIETFFVDAVPCNAQGTS